MLSGGGGNRAARVCLISKQSLPRATAAVARVFAFPRPRKTRLTIIYRAKPFAPAPGGNGFNAVRNDARYSALVAQLKEYS